MYKLLCLFITLFAAASGQAQEIAITFDDVPRPDSRLFSGEERTQKLIAALRKSKVPDIFLFVTTNNITEKSKKRVEAYIEAGFHLGNHSHSHFSAHKKHIETYLSDITVARNQLKGFKNNMPFYRYPYLHEGNDRKTRDRIRQHLREMSYKNGYVTVDNYDWYMDSLLQRALVNGKKVDYDALKNAYITVLWQSILFYDEIANKTLGRSPKHVLLLHENDMAALFIDDLIEHIREQGWKVISPQEAYKDPIAFTIPDVLFNGQGRVAAIAKSKGWDEKLLRDVGSSEDYLDDYFKNNNVFK
ncbi:polysaccharide deacetylase family protein [Pseudoalteromonas denitrificans]|uniref:Polysaccharide deacetylase n=1 Tax=Pseudoalteromonas denitrificans DSM 6059 TaxID=1123010 RepID=A0A1I1IS91_9GAMM|nr:polysaccharide deacetylase family protein [Pseudoalteromonas denitrificans]SFC36090.1 Polysaccharide deacetylase [Pseudoalteromonas denitrificans DSM 6059]